MLSSSFHHQWFILFIARLIVFCAVSRSDVPLLSQERESVNQYIHCFSEWLERATSCSKRWTRRNRKGIIKTRCYSRCCYKKREYGVTYSIVRWAVLVVRTFFTMKITWSRFTQFFYYFLITNDGFMLQYNEIKKTGSCALVAVVIVIFST